MENKECPTWDEAILGITDPRLKDKVYSKIVRYYVEAGARIMYDRLCSMLSSDAVLTSAMHSDAQKQCPSCVDADLINVPTCPKCGYFERR